MSGQIEASALLAQVEQLQGIYDELAQAEQELKRKKSSLLPRWVTGKGQAEQDQLCSEFYSKVETHMEQFCADLETADPAVAAQACGSIMDILLQPVPKGSNSAVDLMKRAMASMAEPLLPYLAREQIQAQYDRITASYRRREMFPVERELVKKMERALAGM